MTDETRNDRLLHSRLPARLHDEIDGDIIQARVLRARLVHKATGRLWRRVVRSLRKDPIQDQIEPAANALAAIRSAVEILRDTPEMDAIDRRRFTDIILREEARLEAMLNTWQHRSA